MARGYISSFDKLPTAVIIPSINFRNPAKQMIAQQVVNNVVNRLMVLQHYTGPLSIGNWACILKLLDEPSRVLQIIEVNTWHQCS